jgi:hypothetical protein
VGAQQLSLYQTVRAAPADLPVLRPEPEIPVDVGSKSEAWQGLQALSQWASTSGLPEPPPGPPPPHSVPVPLSDAEEAWAGWEGPVGMGAPQAGSSRRRALEEAATPEAAAGAAPAGQQRDAAREVVQRYRNWTSDAD